MRVVTGLLVGVLLTSAAAAQDAGGATPGNSSTPHVPRTQMQGRGIRVLTAGEGGTDAVTPVAAAPPVTATRPTPLATPVIPATTQAMVTPAPVMLCTRPINPTDLRLSGDAASGAQLARKLRQGHAVSVDLATPYALKSETPAPLGGWLSAVKATGGTVTVVPYCNEGSRGFFARLFGLFSSNDPGRAFHAARDYDVILHDDERAKTVTQVEFVPRRPAASGGR